MTDLPHRSAQRLAPLLVLAALTISCGSGEDRTEACPYGEDFVEAIVALNNDGGIEDLEAWEDAQSKLLEFAPDDVREALRAERRLDPNSVRGSVQDELDEAQDTVTGWLVKDCDLRVPG